MSIGDRLVQFKAVAATVVGFIKRHKRASVAAVVGLLIVFPLLRGSGGEAFFLNLVGLGIAALVVRRIMRAGDRRKAAQARQANCRCHCRPQQPGQPQNANQQAQGGTP
ncbi:MAG: hypothetical protein OXN21_15670 [Chloroflexota bacterium]|nr:hypothetical protein [Chloroflexota bacterium]